jgi:hypothetical protein
MEIMVQENYCVFEVYLLYLLNMMHKPYSVQVQPWADSQAKSSQNMWMWVCYVKYSEL